MQLRGVVFVALLFATGCAERHWDGQVRSWGGMRQVMREGQTEARVKPTDMLARPHAFGVGAVEGLHGEIVIDDGRCWVGQVAMDGGTPRVAVATMPRSQRATLLTVSYVPAWSDITITGPVRSEDLETFVHDAARRAGIDTDRPFPFVIQGRLSELHAHVINGYCPMAGPEAAGTSPGAEPYRVEGWSGQGKLIGLYAENSAGELTHHGSNLHVHVLTESPPQVVAHVETVSLAPGAKLRLPTR